jgi:AhpD family alkylhydroperoxidase
MPVQPAPAIPAPGQQFQRVRGVRFIEPVLPRRAEGLVREVYGQVRRDFGLLRAPVIGRSPFLVFSPAPRLLAAVWSALYETMLVGQVPRADKELIATAISDLNTCPFCVDAHSALARSAGADALPHPIFEASLDAISDSRHRALARWALATRSPASPLLADPPFVADEAPEIIGTAIAFHFINRMVSVFLGDEPILPAGRTRGLAERLVGVYTGRALRHPRKPGRTLGLLGRTAAPLVTDFQWAARRAHIAAAVAQMDDTIARAADSVLPRQVRKLVSTTIEDWDGSSPGLSRAWTESHLEQLDEQYHPLARLCLLVALAPYQVDEQDITAFRSLRPDDEQLVIACSWSAFVTAKRIGRWLVPNTETKT